MMEVLLEVSIIFRSYLNNKKNSMQRLFSSTRLLVRVRKRVVRSEGISVGRSEGRRDRVKKRVGGSEGIRVGGSEGKRDRVYTQNIPMNTSQEEPVYQGPLCTGYCHAGGVGECVCVYPTPPRLPPFLLFSS